MGQSIKVVTSAASAEALLSPNRLRILHRLSVPGSATSIGPALGLTRQQVSYHLRELEAAGVIELSEERRRGNFMERIYRLVSESIVIAPSALDGLAPAPDRIADRSSSDYLVAIGSRLVEDASGCGLPTMALEMNLRFESESARAEFANELAEAFRSFAAKYHHESGEAGTFRVLAAAHPTVTL